MLGQAMNELLFGLAADVLAAHGTAMVNLSVNIADRRSNRCAARPTRAMIHKANITDKPTPLHRITSNSLYLRLLLLPGRG